MANLHSLFQQFNSNISIGSTKKEKMIKSKNELRERIRKYFKENHPTYEPKFYIQGSCKMKTAIRTKDDICDLDDGVYFFREPDVTATTLQTWVKNAVDGFTSESPEHRKKCIRNIFKSDYEIDNPVYYKVDGGNYKLAVKNEGWEDSDPKGMVDWFNEKKDSDGVLVKIVKYLKAWCDHRRKLMPPGLAMTILASNALQKIGINNKRDDITLRDILKEIKKELDVSFKCIVPAIPNDDLFADYTKEKRDDFMNALETFISDADKALDEKNKQKASNYWRKHLGDRFPEGENVNEEANSTQYASLLGVAAASKPWSEI